MPEVLADLGLPPVPPFTDDPVLKKVRVFQFLFARTEDIDITVKVEGKKRRLLDLVGNQDGTPLLTTLRSVISDTFREAHDEDQHMAILQCIRQKVWDVLPSFNVCLESIEIEPISSKAPQEHG